jgi:hypothetical protein
VHFIGIDPHKDTLAACAVDPHGRPVAHASFPNDPAGYADLVAWALAHRPDRIGVEAPAAWAGKPPSPCNAVAWWWWRSHPSSPLRRVGEAAARPRPTRSTRC